MPEPKKKRITPENALSTSEPSSPMPEQQAFQQHLRALAQSAVRTVLELVMREELDAFIGAAWGACSPKRRGYRNGTYTRESSDSDRSARGDHRAKTIGKVSSIPRTRERYSRYEPHIARSA
jgi:putative transposase